MQQYFKNTLSVMRLLLLTIFLSLTFAASAQSSFTISGTVKDSTTREAIFGASVYLDELKKGNVTNEQGNYTITVPEGNYTLIGKILGYKDFVKKISLNKDIQLNILLSQKVYETQAVIIDIETTDDNVSSTEMGKIELNIEEIKTPARTYGGGGCDENAAVTTGNSIFWRGQLRFICAWWRAGPKTSFCSMMLPSTMRHTSLVSFLFLMPMYWMM